MDRLFTINQDESAAMITANCRSQDHPLLKAKTLWPLVWDVIRQVSFRVSFPERDCSRRYAFNSIYYFELTDQFGNVFLMYSPFGRRRRRCSIEGADRRNREG